MNVLIQQQAPTAQIKEAKYLLKFYMYIQEGLNNGMHVSQALLNAKAMFLGTGVADASSKEEGQSE